MASFLSMPRLTARSIHMPSLIQRDVQQLASPHDRLASQENINDKPFP